MNGRHGPSIEAGGVRFRLWAPSTDGIRLEVEGRGLIAMTAMPGGWREALVRCGVGTRYRFHLGDATFPDPASRAQSGGIRGWSLVCAPPPPDESWRGRAWDEAVLYECHAGLMGGFAGVARALPDLAALGITAVELMPIGAFPGARNWGYDGVLPFAPAEAYGTPDDLRVLIHEAHRLGLMMFLDVVYNHFGPDGNYLPLYAKPFFRTDRPTPWGATIDFRVPEVRDFFAENARHWLFEFGFDGLRFDAVHAMEDEGWLDRLATDLRRKAGDRRIHLVLENENNIASHLRPENGGLRFDAQWNDDIHHAFHVLLTGETGGYYRDYAERSAERLARALHEGFIYQGAASANRNGAPRGTASADLPPTAFVTFLQNHDQIGNRAFGERLTVLANPRALKAAMALLLLMPQIPLLFMGEEIGSRAPFLYFTDHGPELAKAVREGRAHEFAYLAGHDIPDPNAPETFAVCDPVRDAPDRAEWRVFIRDLLAVRKAHVRPKGAKALGAEAIGAKAVAARWRLGDGGLLTIASNFGSEAAVMARPEGMLMWGGDGSSAIPPVSTIAWLKP